MRARFLKYKSDLTSPVLKNLPVAPLGYYVLSYGVQCFPKVAKTHINFIFPLCPYTSVSHILWVFLALELPHPSHSLFFIVFIKV